MPYLQFDYYVLNGAKINDSLPSAQFNMSGYEIRARTDEHGTEGGIIKNEKTAEEAVRRCSSNLMFLKISQYAQKSACVGVSF